LNTEIVQEATILNKTTVCNNWSNLTMHFSLASKVCALAPYSIICGNSKTGFNVNRAKNILCCALKCYKKKTYLAIKARCWITWRC